MEHPEQCRDIIEKLAWSFKYMAEVKERPACFGEELLKKLFMYSKIANMTVDQQELVYKEIEEELKFNSILLTAQRKESEARSREIARNLLSEGIDVDTVARCTGLSMEEVQKLAVGQL